VIGYGEAGDVFEALVAELPGNAQAKWPAECDGKLTAVHTVGDQSLRVQCVGHVDALPPVGLDRTVDNVSDLGESPYEFKDVRERHTPPFGDIRPALFALDSRNLGAIREALELSKRE